MIFKSRDKFIKCGTKLSWTSMQEFQDLSEIDTVCSESHDNFKTFKENGRSHRITVYTVFQKLYVVINYNSLGTRLSNWSAKPKSDGSLYRGMEFPIKSEPAIAAELRDSLQRTDLWLILALPGKDLNPGGWSGWLLLLHHPTGNMSRLSYLQHLHSFLINSDQQILFFFIF